MSLIAVKKVVAQKFSLEESFYSSPIQSFQSLKNISSRQRRAPPPPPPPPPPPLPPQKPENLFPKGYTKHKNMFCKPVFGSYMDPIDAQASCDSDKLCFAIVDTSCNSLGKFHLCQKDAVKSMREWLMSSCIYEKEICNETSQCPADRECINDVCSVPCDNKICNTNGKCFLDIRGNETCKCNSGYSGPYCQYSIHMVKQENTWCEPAMDKEHNNLQESIDMCIKDENCRMFYDVKSKGGRFVFCKSDFIPQKSDLLGSTAFLKCEGGVISGPNRGKPCKFPFTYNGNQYKSCILDESTSFPWCATESNYSDADWGYCNCHQEWKKQESRFCRSHYASHPTLKTAIDQCSRDEKCLSVSDTNCNDPASSTQNGEKYRLCSNASIVEYRFRACIYEKPSIFYDKYVGNNPIDDKKTDNKTTLPPDAQSETFDRYPGEENATLDPMSWETTLFLISIGVAVLVIIVSIRYSISQSKSTCEAIITASKWTFMFFCFILAINMTIKQILRYVNNDDASVVSFKLFLGSKEYEYPTFTICIANDPEIIYTDALNELHVTGTEYANALKGQTESLNDSHKNMENNMDINLNNFIIPLQKIVLAARFETEKENETVYFKAKNKIREQEGTIESVLEKNYQESDKLCFSRNLKSTNKILTARKYDEVVFDVFKIFDDWSSRLGKSNGSLQVFIHYPGQFIRNKDKPIYEKALGALEEKHIDVRLTLSYISLLKKRPNANEKCNGSLKHDDFEFKVQVIRNVDCIPIYWKSLLFDKNLSYPLCNKSIQLAKVHNLINHHHQVMKEYAPPCIQMMTPVNVQEKSWIPLGRSIYKLTVHLKYATETFQEVHNSEDFNVFSLWSNIGGFIGIFLGYSLLQVPEILGTIWIFNWKKLSNFWKNSKSFNGSKTKISVKRTTNKNEKLVIRRGNIGNKVIERKKSPTTKFSKISFVDQKKIKVSSVKSKNPSARLAKTFLESVCIDALYASDMRNLTAKLTKVEERISKLETMNTINLEK